MKIKVLVEFHDMYKTGVIYKPGDVIEFEDNRARSAISYKLCEEYREPVQKPADEPVKEVKKKTTTKKKVENDQ